MKMIKAGGSVISAQLESGYESDSGFREAFTRILGAPPTRLEGYVFKAVWLDTVLGPMLAVADEEKLYLLEFVDRRGLEREIERLRKRFKAAIIPGENAILRQIKAKLENYFSGKSFLFNTPIAMVGSEFQQRVWRALQAIPFGETCSYLALAKAIGQPTACRAVANANGANQLAIIIPCHRVINENGELGGYGGGISKKQWLINHERKNEY